jgi:hypothetical protein
MKFFFMPLGALPMKEVRVSKSAVEKRNPAFSTSVYKCYEEQLRNV